MVRFVRDSAEDSGLILEIPRKRQVRIVAEWLVFGPLFLAWLPGECKFLLDAAWVWLACLAGKGAFLWYGKGTRGLF